MKECNLDFPFVVGFVIVFISFIMADLWIKQKRTGTQFSGSDVVNTPLYCALFQPSHKIIKHGSEHTNDL